MKLSLLLVCLSFAAQAQEVSTPVAGDALPATKVRFGSSNYGYLNPGVVEVGVTPQLIMGAFEGEGKNSGTKYDRSIESQIYNVKLRQALTNTDWAYTVGTSAGNAQAESKTRGEKSKLDYTGLGDIKISVDGIREQTGYNLYYGARAVLSPDDAKIATIETKGNMYSGRQSLTPYIAYESATSFGYVGGELNFTANTTKKTNIGTFEKERETGGNAIGPNAFAEYKKSDYAIGVLGDVALVSESKIKNNLRGNFTSDAGTFLKGGIYGSKDLTKSIGVSAKLTHGFLVDSEQNGVKVDRQDETAFQIGLSAKL